MFNTLTKGGTIISCWFSAQHPQSSWKHERRMHVRGVCTSNSNFSKRTFSLFVLLVVDTLTKTEIIIEHGLVVVCNMHCVGNHCHYSSRVEHLQHDHKLS